MKKKVLAMTLVGTLCTAMLAGCGGQTSANDKAGGDAAATGDAYNVTVIVKHTDGHFNKVIAGARAYGSEHDNVNVEIQSPTSATSYDEQVNMIETALGNPGIDAVIIAPQQSTSTATLVDTATKPVVALDTDFTSDKKACFVGTGNEDAALNGGKAVAEACKALGKADGGYHRRRTGRRDARSTSARLPRCDRSRRRSGARSAVHRHHAGQGSSRYGGGYPEVPEWRRRSSVHRG